MIREGSQMAGERSLRWRSFVGATALAFACAVAFWPGLRSFPEWDDFTLLAFARILRDPFAVFVHEHFPLGPYFRPLAMAVWWLSAQAFGNALAPQYGLNLALHAATSIALWRVVAAWSKRPGAAWAAAVLFGVHPAALGAGLWLANRFDLLAALFALLSLRAAHDLRAQWRRAALLRTFGWALAALASKEVGTVAIAGVAVALAWPRSEATAAEVRRLRALALALGALSAAWFLWRLQVMHGAAETIAFGESGAVVAMLRGVPAWLADFAAYATAWSWLGAPSALIVLVGIGAAGLLAASRSGTHPVMATPALPVAATLLAGCCLIEAPYAAIWSVPFARGAAAASVAGYARLYYLPLCALAIATAPFLARLPLGASRAVLRRWAPIAVVALVALALAGGARDLANAYRRQSIEKRALVDAAVAAVDAAPVGTAGCRIVLLGIDGSGPGYVLKTSSDSVIKALAADIRRIENCLVLTEQAPWVSLVGGARLEPEQARPLTPMLAAAGPARWMNVDGVEIAWLNASASIDARAMTGTVFLRLEGRRFVDVGRQVRDGTVRVAFFCARDRVQCEQP